MQRISEPSRKLPVMAKTDVLVVGSGPGGLAVALAAAREGVDTMLMERYGCFGGNITQVPVESIAWYRHEGTVESEGIGVEFEARAKEMGASRKEPQSCSQALDADMFKYVENLLVAGRCVAGDKISQAAIRQMMCCTVTGQGAGVAAAVSVKDNVTCRRVNIAKVQKALEKQGVRII